MLISNGKRTINTNEVTYKAVYAAKGFKPVTAAPKKATAGN